MTEQELIWTKEKGSKQCMNCKACITICPERCLKFVDKKKVEGFNDKNIVQLKGSRNNSTLCLTGIKKHLKNKLPGIFYIDIDLNSIIKR